MKRFSFKSGCIIRVENGKCTASYSQVTATLSVYIAAKDILVTKKIEHDIFKCECLVQVAKHLKGNWIIVLL